MNVMGTREETESGTREVINRVNSYYVLMYRKRLSKKRLIGNGLVGSRSIELDERDTDYIFYVPRERISFDSNFTRQSSLL